MTLTQLHHRLEIIEEYLSGKRDDLTGDVQDEWQRHSALDGGLIEQFTWEQHDVDLYWVHTTRVQRVDNEQHQKVFFFQGPSSLTWTNCSGLCSL